MSVRRQAADAQAQRFGLTEWFHPRERERVETTLAGIESVGARWLRTHLSWAEYQAPGGRDWYDWLIPTLARRTELLPCIHYTPPSLSRTGDTSGPPKRPRDLADFIDGFLDRYGQYFTHVELWNEPNNPFDWDRAADPDWDLFSEMIGAAAYWTERKGWHAVLGGPCPFDINWLDLMGRRGVLGVVSAVGIHGSPGAGDAGYGRGIGWNRRVHELRRVLAGYNEPAEIWITETGYAAWRYDELEQARRFLDAMDAQANRVYWYSLADLPRDEPVREGRQFDIRHYPVGMLDIHGQDKLLARLLRSGGVSAVRRNVKPARRRPSGASGRPILVTGGAGFIGSNLADTLLASGEEVIIFDNLSRPGVASNIEWLRSRHGNRAIILAADVRDTTAMADAVGAASAVFHFAAQVAVTDSLRSPLEDFTVNTACTLHLLEQLRRKRQRTPLVYASTNKVYGALRDLAVREIDDRHLPLDGKVRKWGLDETQPLHFCTPYGCSKGAADQYVLDYAQSFDLPTVVMRMSCIYGPRQFSTQDQGWVAHFLIRALNDEPINIFGSGRQVRDVLHVADAVRAYRMVLEDVDNLAGRAFNLGGGPKNAVSLLLVLDEIARLLGRPVKRVHEPARTGDQLYFVSDTRQLTTATGWQSRISWRRGLADLFEWLNENGALVGVGLPGKTWKVSA